MNLILEFTIVICSLSQCTYSTEKLCQLGIVKLLIMVMVGPEVLTIHPAKRFRTLTSISLRKLSHHKSQNIIKIFLDAFSGNKHKS